MSNWFAKNNPNRSFGMVPFFYLIYLIPLVISMFPFSQPLDWVMLVFLGVFIKWYLDGFQEEQQTDVTVIKLLMMGVIFTLYKGYASLFIYPAWLFSFWMISQKTFKRYCVWYYVAVTVSSIMSIWLGLDEISDIWLWVSIGLAFVYVSPIMARSIYKEQQRVEQLNMDNNRLMTIIKQGERDRIAQDLHDTMGQSYSTMAVKAELAAKLVAKNPEAAVKEITDIAEMSRSNLNVVREIVANLNERTIATAMVEASHALKALDMVTTISGEPEAMQWPIEVQHVIAAVIKEGTTNIIRHSQANKVSYQFELKPDNYQFRLMDNGVGLKIQTNNGFGLKGIENRVLALEGEFAIKSDSGTVITITLPREN
ncbi:sensor histidine kinase [Fundicoccus culcitae]|uniref:histidine kinase n=1 Tax=Fundicoccus culcitae TaxID=2969821 RepID=A0ABY5P548_9LACT|nr:sensor histidine kinase [Fundicoccus culcitae]UUX33879.1 sensor histidine kinase [Fundicoccus culcitae]